MAAQLLLNLQGFGPLSFPPHHLMEDARISAPRASCLDSPLISNILEDMLHGHFPPVKLLVNLY